MSGLIKRFNEVIIEEVPRADNAGVDALAKMGSQREATMLGVTPLKIQIRPNIQEEVVMTPQTLLDQDVDNSSLGICQGRNYPR